MFNTAAEYLAHGARSLGPLARLQPEQRRRVDKSSEKISKILGERPIVDIVSSSVGTDGITSEAEERKEKKRGGKWKKGSSPPILRLKLAPLRRKSTRVLPRTPRTAGTRTSYVPRFLPPGARPAVRMSETSTLQDALFLSPLPPVSPFSPIATAVVLDQQSQGFRQQAYTSHALYSTPKEMSSIVEATEEVENVGSYLDLYRVANRNVRDVDGISAVTDLDTAYTAYTDATNPDDAYTAYIACTPSSAIHRRRRSSSFSHGPRPSVLSDSSTPVPRSSFIVPHSASVYSFQDQPGRYTLVIKVPSPLSPGALVPFTSSTVNSSRLSRTRTFVLGTPKRARRDTLLETPGDEGSPLQQQQSEARLRAVLGAMAESPALPSTPNPARTPHGPYWVRQSYRVSGQGSIRRRKSSARPPPTPRTVRRERRQGWGGEWKAGRMGAAVEGLKDIETPVPRVSRRLTDENVPPVPMKDFIVIQ